MTTYSAEIVYHLVRLWDAMGRPCSIRFKAAVPEWIEFDPDPILRKNASYRELVLKVSRSHLDRLLRPYRTGNRKGPSLTRQGLRSFRNRIPIEPKDWNVTAPGHVQSDTVAHCGDCLEGGFANTLTVTDIHTTWTETRGLWGKGAVRVVEAMKQIETALPFAITTFKSDSGSEFMNYDLHHYFSQRDASSAVKMVRSRPYKKDDNCYVEQKNDVPRTPYQRLMECAGISDESKETLKKRRAELNPFRLQEGLDKKLKAFEELLRQKSTGRLRAALVISNA